MAGNQVAFTLIAEDAQAQAQIDKFLQDFQGKSKQATKSIGDGFDSAEKKGLSFVKSMVTGLIGIGSAAGLAATAINSVVKAETEAIAAARTGEDARRRLAQIPAANAAELRQRFAAMETISKQQGISEAEAGNFLFDMISANIPIEQAIKDARVFQVRGGAQLATGAQALVNAFGAGEAGTAAGMQSKIMAGAGFAKADIAQFSVAAARVANAKDIGATDEEALATLAVLSQTTGNTSEAATLQKAFATAAKRMESEAGIDMTGGIVESARRIRAEGLDNVESMSAEGLQGLNFILNNADAIEASTARISAAQNEDLLGKQIAMFSAASGTDVALNVGDKIDQAIEAEKKRQAQRAQAIKDKGKLAELEARKADVPEMLIPAIRGGAALQARHELSAEERGAVGTRTAEELRMDREMRRELAMMGVPLDELPKPRAPKDPVVRALEENTRAIERNTDGAIAPAGSEAAQEF